MPTNGIVYRFFGAIKAYSNTLKLLGPPYKTS